MKTKSQSAFTLVELIMTTAAFSTLGIALLSFGWTSSRLIAKNLATNHSHEGVMSAEQRMMAAIHASGSPVKLQTCTGSTYTDFLAGTSGDTDPLTGLKISNRANGIRFWRTAGGPFQLTANTTPSSTTLTFNFAPNGVVTYVPQIGDKVWVPLVDAKLTITAINATPTSGSPNGRFTVSTPLGFTFGNTSTNITTGYFFRQAAYSVQNNELRFHPNFTGGAKNTYSIVRTGITSPKPFALIGTDPSLDMRISLEFYDSKWTARRFLGGATTLQSVISVRTQPAPVDLTE